MELKALGKREERKKSVTISEILILILSTIAFSYILASAIPAVSAEPPTSCSSTVSIGKCIMVGGVNTKVAGNQGDPYWADAFCRSSLVGSNINNVCKNDGPCSGKYRITAPEVICQTVTPPPALTSPTFGFTVPSFLQGGLMNSLGSKPASTTPSPGTPTTPPTPPAPVPNQLAYGKFLSWETGKYIVTNAAYTLGIYVGVKFVFGQLGGFAAENAGVAGTGAALGYATVKFLIPILQRLKIIGTVSGPAGWIIGIGIAIWYFIFNAKSTRYYSYTFNCYVWDAPTGGASCEKCNQGNIPCTEYRCKSLGQGCELVNQGTNEEMCVWNNSRDVTPPVLSPWTNILTTGYKYIPDTSSPPGLGWKIVPTENSSGCVKAFTPLTFGITSNEPAKCKLDPEKKDNFSDMDLYFGGSSTTKYNHSQTISQPSVAALEAEENITIENGNQYSLYARCQDTNGNANVQNIAFKFCIDKSPDNTAPNITTTSIINGMPILYNQSSVDLKVYVNEPAECRWSRTDQDYSSMENNMSCSTGVLEMNAQSLYPCSTTLTGLKNSQNNTFYFRCLDQPYLKGTANESRRNANTESYKFTLVGTQPLVLKSVGPNGTIKDSTDVIKVTLTAETLAGYNEGAAICYYNGSGTNNEFIEFYPNTGGYQHSQDLYLVAGDYNYQIKCIDAGGNAAVNSTSFTVESDTQAPIVVRAYHNENSLNIVTDENATCVYSNTASIGCSYDPIKDGIAMQSLDNNNHQVSWDTTKTFYIKCQDSFGNQPLPDQCNIIVTPFGFIQNSP